VPDTEDIGPCRRERSADGSTMTGTQPGSDWTSERLAELSDEGYRPAAWLEFLRLSLERSSEHRRRYRRVHRQLRRWMTVWGLATLASRRVPRLPKAPARADLVLLAGTWLMMRWHLGMLNGTGTREARLASADAVSLTRLWLGPRMRHAGSDPAAFIAILFLGAVTDVLDGRLARKHETTRLGRDLDSLTDVAFFRAAGRAAREAGLGRRAAIAFELRLLLGPAYAAWHYFRFARPPAAPARVPAYVTKAISLAGIAASVTGRDGDLAVLSSSAAALAIQVTSESRANWLAARGAEPEGAHARSKRRTG